MPSSPSNPLASGKSESIDIQSRVRAALLAVIFSDQPLSLAAAAVFGLTITLILQSAEQSIVMWWWFAAIIVILAIRFREYRQFRQGFRPQHNLRYWERRLLVGSTVTAIFWALVGWYGYHVDSATVRIAIIMLVGGVVAASSRTLSCHGPTFFTYVIISGAPLSIQIAVGYHPGGVLVATFASLYIVLMLGLGVNFRKTVARSFRLQFENADLVARLQRDVAARAAAEEALRESEQRLQLTRHALDHAQDMVAVVDREGSFLYVNEGFCRTAGRTAEELSQLKTWDGIIPNDAAGFRDRWDHLKRSGSLTFESALIRKDGSKLPVEVNASYVVLAGREAACAIARDLSARHAAETEKLRLQQQLQETQRLESLGVLAGGVAHDFNNLLTAILGNASLARETLNDPPVAKQMLGQIEIAANQAAGLCRQMLAYAGHGQLRIEPLNISSIVLESAKLLEMTIAHRARLELQLAAELPSILADASQLRQVVLNLVHNAAEAMERQTGAIIVTTAPAHIDQAAIASARVRSEIDSGPGVTLIVSDTGSGMTPETLERIFDPFFTTKFTGRGLGLPAVLGIVRSHRGLLHVETKVGIGSTFRVTFSASQVAKPAAAPQPKALERTSGGHVLVIEDEESVRRVAQQVLMRMGYSVDTATDGASGVTRVTREPNRYALVLVDMTMPRMDGAVTLRQMRKLGLTAPAILMSGLSEQQVRPRLEDVTDVRFLAKPFDVATLIAAVESVMAERTAKT